MATEHDAEEVLEASLALDSAYTTLLTPTEAAAAMHLRVPARGNRKLRRLLEAVGDDDQIKGWWHTANVNAVLRLEINDHSWVHIQIVTNIALKLLRQLVKHGVDVRDVPPALELGVAVHALHDRPELAVAPHGDVDAHRRDRLGRRHARLAAGLLRDGLLDPLRLLFGLSVDRHRHLAYVGARR